MNGRKKAAQQYCNEYRVAQQETEAEESKTSLHGPDSMAYMRSDEGDLCGQHPGQSDLDKVSANAGRLTARAKRWIARFSHGY